MKYLCSTFFLFYLIITSISTYTQEYTINSELSVIEVKKKNDFIYIDLEIPYDGVVEIKVLDENEKIIYNNHYNKKQGYSQIKVSVYRLKNPGTYYYKLTYKGKDTVDILYEY